MKNLIKCKELLDSKGVYQIINTVTQKKYIGSTTQNFRKRCWQHRTELNRKNHKNLHLQRSYDKYGPNVFLFDIIKVIDKDEAIREEEQLLLNLYKKEDLYNINTNAMIPTDEITIAKRTIGIKKATRERMKRYHMWLNKEKLDSYFSEKELHWFNKLKNPWNKNKKLSKEHILKLKTVERKITKEGLEKKKLAHRLNSPCIEVYLEDHLLAIFRSPIDLQEHSMKDDFPLIKYMKLVNKKGRNGYPPGRMCRIRILKCIKENILYKGFTFKSVNARCISNGVNESDEFMESLYFI